MRINKRYRNIPVGVALLLLLICGTATAQRPEEPTRWDRFVSRTKEYVMGEPWRFDGSLSTTHRELLLGFGRAGVRDEYLSPSTHTGWDFHLFLGTDRPYFAPKWHLRQELELGVGLPKNQANGSVMYLPRLYGQTAFAYDLAERGGLRLEVAPAWSLMVQGDLKLSNTNNVVNVKATTGADAWGRVSYRFPWETLPMRLSYSVTLPLLHLAFHPEYGQSFYEYVSGDNPSRIGLHFTSLHNSLSVRQQLLVELPIHNLTCTLGLQHHGMRERINHTTYRYGRVGLVVGVSLRTATLSGNRALRSPHLSSSF